MKKKTRKQSHRRRNPEKLIVTGGEIVKARSSGELNRINEHAAGIDVGADRHFVAVPPGSSEHPVCVFGTFTKDLNALADWLEQCGVKTVVMESTGVYWIALYELLEKRGFQVKLVDARKVKNVSGRKSDVLDCQWLQQLESYGLLQAAYRPPDVIVVLRSYVRQREMLAKSAASHIQHMQKALQQMNLRLDNVVRDITGQTGMRIIKAILSGERDAKKMGEMRDHRCHSSAEEISASLEGTYREEHLFSLKQAVDLYEYYQEKILECEAEMEKYLSTVPHVREDEPPELPMKEKRNLLSFNVREHAYKLVGVDLFRVRGLGSETILRLVSEVGTDVSGFPTEKHFSSWLCLSPNRKISGGKELSNRTNPTRNRATAAFMQAAVCMGRTQSELGAFYRRKQAEKGPGCAVKATAHKIAKLYYSLVKNGVEYEEQGAQAYEERARARTIATMKKRAKSLGYELVPAAA
jgi:transposase